MSTDKEGLIIDEAGQQLRDDVKLNTMNQINYFIGEVSKAFKEVYQANRIAPIADISDVNKIIGWKLVERIARGFDNILASQQSVLLPQRPYLYFDSNQRDCSSL